MSLAQQYYCRQIFYFNIITIYKTDLYYFFVVWHGYGERRSEILIAIRDFLYKKYDKMFLWRCHPG